MSEKSSINMLQEYAVFENFAMPIYEFDIESGNFVCNVTACGITARAIGRSKKEAKHNCAKEALKKLVKDESIQAAGGVDHLEDISYTNINSITGTNIAHSNYVGQLQELCAKYVGGNYHPSYKIDILCKEGLGFVAHCQIGNHITKGHGENKKIAKQAAAKQMLEQLSDTGALKELHKEVCNFEIKNEDKVVSTYKELSFSLVQKLQKLGIHENHGHGETVSTKKETASRNTSLLVCQNQSENEQSLGECLKKLEDMDFQFEEVVLQNSPFIVFIKKTNSFATFCGMADTYRKAKIQALANAVQYGHMF